MRTGIGRKGWIGAGVAIGLLGCTGNDFSDLFRSERPKPAVRKPSKAGAFSAEGLKLRGLAPAWSLPFSKEEGTLQQTFLIGAEPSRPDTVYAQTTRGDLFAIDVRSGAPAGRRQRCPFSKPLNFPAGVVPGLHPHARWSLRGSP